MKNIDPMKPPRIVILPSVPSSSLKTCIAAKVKIERAVEDTNEYGVGSADEANVEIQHINAEREKETDERLPITQRLAHT